MDEAHAPAGAFPVLKSLLAVDALARVLEANYGLKNVWCQLIKGTIRDTYRVTARDAPYILSIYRHGQRAINEILAELDLLDHLAADGILAPTAVPQRNGERIFGLSAPEGIRYGVLFTYIPGRHLSRQPDLEPARRYGRAIARLHVRADELPTPLYRPRIDFESIVERSIDAFASVVTHRPDVVAYMHEVAEIVRPLISPLPTDMPGYGLVHGDVIPSNAQVTPQGEVALLDFDFCGYCWRAYDIATYLGEVKYWDASAAAADAFLDGYGAVRPLQEWELRALPAFAAARHIQSLGTPAMNVNEWGSAYLSDHMIDTLLGGLRQSMAEIG